MIVVTGATGHVGRELVTLLSDQRVTVRVVTRRPGAVSFPAGVQVAYGDFEDPASIDVAFAGAERAFLMSGQPVGSAPFPTHDIVLAEAARKAGVAHIVKLSVLEGGGARDDPIATWSRQAEQAVLDSGIDWTLLRPGRFMSNALVWAPMIKRGDTVMIPFARRPAASIDPADIAAVAAAALTDSGPRHVNVAYELSGPEVLTPADELRILGETLGRSLQVVEPPLDQTRAGMVKAGMPEVVVDTVVDRAVNDDSGAEVLPTVQHVLGRPATPFATWAASHADAFRGKRPS
jgi:uncharacterized protein YbjT (DUF2867 family)